MKEKMKIIESCSFSYSKPNKLQNEDAVLPAFESNNSIYMALADGVGGRPGGHVASQVAIETIKNLILNKPNKDMKFILSSVRDKLREEINKDSSLQKMATTLVIVKISNGIIEFANIGDSRAYLAEGLKLKLVTRDQTEKQTLIDNKVFKKKDLKGHKSESVLVNSMSSKWDYDFESLKISCNKGTVILMSDGAYENVEETRVIGNNKSDDLLSTCSNIKKRITKKTAKDDYSLVAVSFEV